MPHDIVIIMFSWLLLSLFGLISLPLVVLTVGRILPDKGWAWLRIVGWLLVAVPVWFLAHVGIPINTTAGIWLVLLGLLGVSGFLLYVFGSEIMAALKPQKNIIFLEEGLFAFGLVFLTLVRGFAPDINGLEKFMDAGLMVSYLNSPTLPIKDMWLAGQTFNYYTFGHFMGAVATQVIRQPIENAYNLMLGFLMGLTLVQSFGLILALLGERLKQRWVWVSALVGSIVVVFGGNSQHIWYLLKNHSFAGYWYPDATRFIPFTIHEFPTYSFIVSDLHAHVWSMILVLFTLLVLWVWVRSNLQTADRLRQGKQAAPSKSRKKLKGANQVSSFTQAAQSHLTVLFSAANLAKLNQPYILAVPLGFMFGLLASTSTWDTLIYGLFLCIAGVGLLWYSKFKLFKPLIMSAVILALAAAVAAAPWWLTFTSISEGARLVTERSEVWRLLALWTGHLIMSAVALAVAIRAFVKKSLPSQTTFFVICMVLTAWVLLILPELFYMKDIYPSHPRANTMFKLTFQAIILMTLSGAWAFGALLSQKKLKQVVRVGLLSLLGIIFALFLIYPYFGYRDYYNRLSDYRGMNGLAWLARDNPTDFAGIEWLRENISGQPVVLEAVGESYTTFARVSAFTSFPTVLGWRVHEWLWRGSFDIPGERTPQVENMYLHPTSYEARQKMNQYGVEYIFVGDKEREAYPALDELGLKSLGEVVFEQGRTFIVHRTR